MRKIIVFGDSTTSDYTEEAYPQQGWAYYLPKYVEPGVEVKNFAQGGASLKSFLYSPDYISGKARHNEPDKSKWNSLILPEVSEGDTVIFYWGGINDMLQSSKDGYREAENGTYVRDWQNTSGESYILIGEGLGTHDYFTLRSEIEEMKELLCNMILQVQEKGAIAIVIKGTGKYYKVHGQDKNVISVTRKYADAVIDAAKACRAEYFDMGIEIEKEFFENGYEKTLDKYFLPVSLVKRFCEEKGICRPLPVVDDIVHYNCQGAEKICQKFIQEARKRCGEGVSLFSKR